MDILIPILVLPFAISIIRNLLYQLFLWQLKEYRLDRFLVHLKTWQGRQLLFGKLATIKWLLLLFAPLLFFIAPPLLFLTVFATFSIEALVYIKQLLIDGWRLPALTAKTILVIVSVLFLLITAFMTFPSWLPVKALILDRVLLFLTGLVVILANIPAKIFHQMVINKAKRKIKNHPHLLTIGITGSYGKSTTKEFLAQILAQKYQVFKTPANINTDIGVAKTILRSLRNDHHFFVCEMGAYKKGEIKAICEIVNPKIGIITGINEQHLALFGSLGKTIAAKFELIKTLPSKGLAVFNGENKYCLKMADKAKAIGRKVKIVNKDGVDSKRNLLDEIFLINFLMAKAVAENLGMKSKEIFQVAKKLKLPSHRMQIIKKDSLTLIDDTYNSNPQGVMEALDFLNTFKGEKIFVFQPMIELGESSRRLHEKVGEKAAKICDQIFLTNKNFCKDFVEGTKDKVSFEKRLPKIKKGAILFEGRETRQLLKLLMSNF